MNLFDEIHNFIKMINVLGVWYHREQRHAQHQSHWNLETKTWLEKRGTAIWRMQLVILRRLVAAASGEKHRPQVHAVSGESSISYGAEGYDIFLEPEHSFVHRHDRANT